jgi:hypothetical protein
MINYYYEIQDGVTLFGRQIKYLAMYNYHPGQPGFPHSTHDEAIKYSQRVWLENANGTSLVKGPMGELVQEHVDERELVWLKLLCKDIESI